LNIVDGNASVFFNADNPKVPHLTGVLRKWTVNDKYVQTDVLPVNYAGGPLTPPDGAAGDKIGVSWAWQTWADVEVYGSWKPVGIEGTFGQEFNWQRTAKDAPEVVNTDSPKADG
jgi:hypothetical protein